MIRKKGFDILGGFRETPEIPLNPPLEKGEIGGFEYVLALLPQQGTGDGVLVYLPGSLHQL
ncbi:MAG: hypothetical protein V1849_00500, partial [Chloroflexota bacterium]